MLIASRNCGLTSWGYATKDEILQIIFLWRGQLLKAHIRKSISFTLGQKCWSLSRNFTWLHNKCLSPIPNSFYKIWTGYPKETWNVAVICHFLGFNAAPQHDVMQISPILSNEGRPRLTERMVFIGPRCPWSDLWIRLSLTNSHTFWNLTDVTLADEDTNSILTDNANRSIQGNVAMQLTQPGG